MPKKDRKKQLEHMHFMLMDIADVGLNRELKAARAGGTREERPLSHMDVKAMRECAGLIGDLKKAEEALGIGAPALERHQGVVLLPPVMADPAAGEEP